uniref:Uncharacterized protein n=1 Tax=Anguilla anguilla TaxID=7936 RepID=A0A0E9PVT1_ANGAN
MMLLSILFKSVSHHYSYLGNFNYVKQIVTAL